MNIKVVYFANLLKNWEIIVVEQLDELKKLELYSKAKHIYISVISNDIELQKLKILLNTNYSKIQLINVYDKNIYEYPGMKTVYQIARDDDNEIILYFHSKGITSNQHEIRKYLFKNTIENYNIYIDEFNKNNELEVAGVFPNKDGFIYFNFFWARSSYIRNFCSKPEISENRYIWEVWIGNEFSRKKNIISFSTLVGYYKLQKSNEIWNIALKYKNETKVNETKVNETKVNETKVNETNVNETKVNETKLNETKVNETKVNTPTRIYTTSDLSNLNKPKRVYNDKDKLTNSNDIINNLKIDNSKIDEYINKFKNKNKVFINISFENLNEYNYFFKEIIECNNLVQIKNRDDVTLKELLFNNVYRNSKTIAFIYYNIDNLSNLEDLFHHSFINKIPLLLKINIEINKYNYLLSYFNYDKNIIIGNYVLFQPKNVPSLQMVKKNISVLIIGYNQFTYIKNMVSQLEKYTNDIVIIDNNSSYEPLLNYYKNEYKYSLLKMDKNYGHKIYEKDFLKGIFGDLYILTDPDLEFNKNLPNNFIEEMINISTYYEAEKVGFALLIDANDIRNVISFGKSIIDFEKQYWMCKFYYPKHELYSAAIDTTFCLINKNNKGGHYRIAGDYTCKHLPWHIGFEKQLVKGEYEYYNKNNISTNYWKK